MVFSVFLFFIREWLFSVLRVAISWLYFSIFESSYKQATPGKIDLKLKVTDLNGQRISFWRATGRYFAKIVSGLILYIGFLMIFFTKKRQGLHDLWAKCLVVRQ